MPVKPQTIVCVIVYNRLNNLHKWLHAWKQCIRPDSRIAIIHNFDGRSPDKEFKRLCDTYNTDYYIPRHNAGFDIGAFQDFITHSLPILYKWDVLHWCVDDTIPMKKDWLTIYRNLLFLGNTGCVATHISNEYQKHVRTNSFMIRREVTEHLKFPGTKVSTKLDCYEFEHRGFNMMNQIQTLGYKAVQASSNINKYFWDHEYLARYNLMYAYEKEFGKLN